MDEGDAREGRAREGAEAAWFEERVMALLPDLTSAARYMADRRAEAEDVVAEAVARAWEHRDDLEDRDRFRGWIFRILRNCYLGRRRKQDRGPDEVPLPGEDDDEPSFSLFERLHRPFLLWWGDPEEEFFDRLLQEDLERAVEQLPEVYRSVLVLADVQGLSYDEIADALDVPVGTVRSRLSRARSRLQETLWDHAVDAGLRDPRGEDGGGENATTRNASGPGP
jgi:RNA polymerase sigma-70 factor (ECF subfamily)